MKDVTNVKAPANRRSFMKMGLAAGGLAVGSRLLTAGTSVAGPPLSNGDAAILKFLAAAELIEADLWQQYAGRAEPRGVSERLPDCQGTGAGGFRCVPHPAEQPGDRGTTNRPADQSDAAYGGHQLVCAVPQHDQSGFRRHV